jgi:diguanylate cyclase (GGDEF)-like protein
MAGILRAIRRAEASSPWLPGWCRSRSILFWLGMNLAVALAYIGLGWAVGRFFAAFGLFPAPIWLPAGLAAAASMLGGWRLTFGIFLGSFVVNAMVFGAALDVTAGISVGNALGPLAGVTLTRWLRPASGLFTRFSGVVAFIAGAVLLHSAITGAVGSLSLVLLGGMPWHALPGAWGNWLLCDAGGTFYFAPSLALWLGLERTPPVPADRRLNPNGARHQGIRGQGASQNGRLGSRAARHVLMLDGAVWVATLGLAILVFSVKLPPGLPSAQLVFLLAVPLSWIALRISLRAAYTLLTLICIVASAGTVAGLGPFQGQGAANPLQSASILIVLCAMNILTLLALVSERREAELALVDANLSLEYRVAERTEQLRGQAETDALTGIANRRGFLRRAESALVMARGLEQSFGLITFDLDHFKAINDQGGHAGGDAVLKLVAQCCVPVLRKDDLFGRLGGEEFAIALPGADRLATLRMAERLRQALREVRPDFALPNGQVAASFGVAMRLTGEGLGGLLLRADDALYSAKRAGRDQVCEARDLAEDQLEGA